VDPTRYPTQNGRVHVVHITERAKAIIDAQPRLGPYVFSAIGKRPLSDFGNIKRKIDALSSVMDWRLHDLRRTCVSGMAALGIAPHVAEKIINHTGGTISGVAAVYQRHEFMAERKGAMEAWEEHVAELVAG
jgi:integrase